MSKDCALKKSLVYCLVSPTLLGSGSVSTRTKLSVKEKRDVFWAGKSFACFSRLKMLFDNWGCFAWLLLLCSVRTVTVYFFHDYSSARRAVAAAVAKEYRYTLTAQPEPSTAAEFHSPSPPLVTGAVLPRCV